MNIHKNIFKLRVFSFYKEQIKATNLAFYNFKSYIEEVNAFGGISC